jgi:hypothetical protein
VSFSTGTFSNLLAIIILQLCYQVLHMCLAVPGNGTQRSHKGISFFLL